MLIQSLYIGNYKMFNPSPKLKLGKEILLFIGVNGSGKSTILEALAMIFSDLINFCNGEDLSEDAFSYEINYVYSLDELLYDSTISEDYRFSICEVIISFSSENGLNMLVHGQPIKNKREMKKYIPNNLIFYYAGFSNTLENIVSKREMDIALKLKNSDSEENLYKIFDKSITYIRKEHYSALFLANYVDTENPIIIAGKKLTISNIDFIFKKPNDFGNNEFKNFYNIQGFLRSFLNNLLPYSQPITEIGEGRNHIGAKLTLEFYRGILDAIEDMPNIEARTRFDNTRYLAFQILNLLFKIGILKEVNISVKDQNDNIFNINDLSEGEQQIITIESINRVLCVYNTVLFFDEPDSFLHPMRQRELIPFLKKQFKRRFSDETTQLIITSHSPFIAQSIEIDSILHFSKNGKLTNKPEIEVMSYTSIADELFNVKSEFGIEIEEEFAKFRRIRAKIFNSEPYSEREFYITIEKLTNKGDEITAILNRELNQINKFLNQN